MANSTVSNLGHLAGLQDITQNETLFYDGHFYDLIFQHSPQYEQKCEDVQFWLDMSRHYGSPVLELACGTGRVSTALREQGFDVTGLDISASMLAVAQEKSAGVRYLQRDVRNFDLGQQFPLIIFPYDTFTHLHTLADVKACLRCVKQHLTPDGCFILDFKNPSYVFNETQAQRPTLYSTFKDPHHDRMVTVMREGRYDPSEQMYHRTLSFTWDGLEDVVRETLTLRIFFAKEIEFLLMENGLSVDQRFGNYQQHCFSNNSPQHILVCTN